MIKKSKGPRFFDKGSSGGRGKKGTTTKTKTEIKTILSISTEEKRAHAFELIFLFEKSVKNHNFEDKNEPSNKNESEQKPLNLKDISSLEIKPNVQNKKIEIKFFYLNGFHRFTHKFENELLIPYVFEQIIFAARKLEENKTIEIFNHSSKILSMKLINDKTNFFAALKEMLQPELKLKVKNDRSYMQIQENEDSEIKENGCLKCSLQ